ncbi:tetratricopeptide repeat protein [Natronomonas gomsonensis]|uniref:tetratricopeptide repeat protein n=1 Tax=Natronomonas gomsonensis TaxID=1046043 RepID=UPI0015BD2AC8|nr:tetratricopeptide repeat protein [Natronomonas gomsonensis]
MVEEQAVSLFINLAATGITAGSGVASRKAQDVLRRRTHQEDLEHVATEFSKALRQSIVDVDARTDTNELAAVADNWEAVITELAGLSEDASHPVHTPGERDQLDFLLHADTETDAVQEITEAIATANGFDLADTPQLRGELTDAVAEAYCEALVDFQHRIAGTDLADVFQQELGLHLSDQLADAQQRLTTLTEIGNQLLTQDARNEGFRQLSPPYFQRTPVTPELSWRTTFSLADVAADIPAQRTGIDADVASQELLESLKTGTDRLVIGRAGSGKSTLCKQVAIEWYRNDDTGPVFYRDTDRAGSRFESRESLRQAIEHAQGHVLVGVEDVVRSDARAVLRVVEEYDDDPEVSFLLDARSSELDDEMGARGYDESMARRTRAIIDDVTPYTLPVISKPDVQRVVDSFEDATGRTVAQSSSELYETVRSEDIDGIGAFMLLAFHLPFGTDSVENDDQAETGLEGHVRSRYETINRPADRQSLRDLSQFDPDLLADVAVMVNLLNASGIGIYPELVHALGYEYGHDIDTHDEIAAIRDALTGWFLYPVETGEQAHTTHPLWSTLYLRVLAQDHADQQADSRRRRRSEPRTGRCLDALFRLFDDTDHHESTAREFPQSSVLTEIETLPSETADDYVRSVMDLCRKWPILGPLVGTSETARYALPECCPDSSHQQARLSRAWTHLQNGSKDHAKSEYETVLERSDILHPREKVAALAGLGTIAHQRGNPEQANDIQEERLEICRRAGYSIGEADALDSLGNIALVLGEYQTAKEYYQQSLDLFQDVGFSFGEAQSLNNLGVLAQEMREYERAREYHSRSLDIYRELGARQMEARVMSALGSVAKSLGEFESARENYQQSLAISREIGDSLGEAKNFEGLGTVSEQAGDHQQAEEYYERSLELFEAVDDPRGQASSLNNLGDIAKEREDLEQAESYYQKSLALYRETGDRRGEAGSLNSFGLIARSRGDLEMAHEYYQESLEIFRDMNKRGDEALVLTNLGNLAQDRGDLAEAISYHEQRLDISQDLDDSQEVVASLTSLADLAEERGHLETATEYLQRSLDASRTLDDRTVEGVLLERLGEVTGDRGQFTRARGYYQASLEIFQEIGTPADTVLIQVHLGTLALLLGEYHQARTHTQESLAIARDVDHAPVESLCLTLLGEVAHQLGDYETATEYLNQSLDIAREIGHTRGETRVLRTLGEVARSQQEYEDAKRYHQQSLNSYRALDDEQNQAEVLRDFGTTLLLEGRPTEARTHFDESLDMDVEIEHPRQEALSQGTLAALDLAEGETTTARDQRDEAISSLREMDLLPDELQVLRIHLQIEREYGDDEVARTLYQHACERIENADLPLDSHRERLDHQVGPVL